MVAPSTALRPVRVWDLPTRLFHWALAGLVLFSWISVRSNWMQLHLLSGFSILALLLFRVAWGFVGSETARFGRFLRSPLAALRHLRHLPRREPDAQVGHNAAGGWMVLAMLLLLAVQAGTGLFANDDAITQGPFADYAGKAVSDRFAAAHALNFKLIEIVVLLHLLAIAAYRVLKGHNLVRPMLTGRKLLPPGVAPPRMVSPLWAAVALACAAGIATVVAAGP